MRPNDLAANMANAAYLDQLFAQYKQDPHSLPEAWRAFFAGFDVGVGQSERPVVSVEALPVNVSVFDLVHSYRELGHHCATLDPLGLVKRHPHASLDLKNFNITEADLDKQAGNGGFQGDTDGTIRDLLAKLHQTYCGSIGIEFTGISNPEQRAWLEKRIEQNCNQPNLSQEQQHALMFQLVAAEEFEQFLGRTFVGVKRFGVEGAESSIALLNTLVDHGAALGGEQFILCMAHRGRLNSLAHVMNKPYETILGEFAGTNKKPDGDLGDGDVKYHMGYANTRKTKPTLAGEATENQRANAVPAGDGEPKAAGKIVKISLLPNPSHLELINPIHQGIVRCKQEWLGDVQRQKVLPIQIHGDAAFVGQGVVTETLNLSELPGWRTGGTLHVIVNNQVGFTTPPSQDRFTPYPTDMAKGIEAPIFHVNGDDPEAVVHVAKIAMEFRQTFQCDVIIDLWCYRRLGHNETDEPSYTQPLMYKRIKEIATTRQLYAEKLTRDGRMTAQEHEAMKAEAIKRLSEARDKSKEPKVRDKVPKYSGVWSGLRPYKPGVDHWSSDTGVSAATLEQVISSYEHLPENLTPHPKLVKLIDERKDAVRKDAGLDWGTAEMLAFGSLVLEGHRVRLTGQDVERGTFSHRHAGLNDYETGEVYFPLKNLGPNQASFTARNSMLSEFAVLGFEWGYASSDPRNLILWEAQFGDFVNGAQPIIDQILVSAESKWRYSCGLTMLLPHGYEGAGPEHSNGYLDRFLAGFAEDNIQVCVPSTPANYFHMLRRQIHRPFRKPLICMMPKALLRRKDSRLAELIGDAKIRLVIDDPRHEGKSYDAVKRVICCSGKVYYTLDAARQENKVTDVALVRIEQLAPFPQAELSAILNRYRRTQEVAWVQEEPANRGGWRYIEPLLRQMLPDTLVTYFGREASASPASGSMKASAEEEAQFVKEALDLKSARGLQEQAAVVMKEGTKAVPD